MNSKCKLQRNFFQLCLAALLCGIVVFSMYSCKGSDGPTGPTGNANIRMYLFDSVTTTTGYFQYTIDDSLSRGFVDSCLILAFYHPSNHQPEMWYPVPGLGPEATYMTRWYISISGGSRYMFTVELENPSGSGAYTGSATFTKFKLIFAPASVILPMVKIGQVKTDNYYSVVKALGMQD